MLLATSVPSSIPSLSVSARSGRVRLANSCVLVSPSLSPSSCASLLPTTSPKSLSQPSASPSLSVSVRSALKLISALARLSSLTAGVKLVALMVKLVSASKYTGPVWRTIAVNAMVWPGNIVAIRQFSSPWLMPQPFGAPESSTISRVDPGS